MQASPSRAITTLLFCTAAALLEGFDNQAMGVAAPRLIKEFGLSPVESASVLSAGTLGLAVGAMIGGRVADYVGRKWALIISLVLFGAGSLATAMSEGVTALFIVRLLTGLGLGGAMPNFITLASECVPAEKRLFVVTAISAALPAGGACAGLIALADGSSSGWRLIFNVGGIAPLFVGVGMVWFLSESAEFKRVATSIGQSTTKGRPEPMLKVLFGSGQARTTALLWIAFFFTQLVLLLMLNWLPSLLVNSGLSGRQASWSSIVFNLGGGLGAGVIGYQQSGKNRRSWVVATYVGMAIALAVVGSVNHLFVWTLAASAAAGVFIIGAQLVLFGLAPLYYATPVRTTGVGGAVSVGRFGSVFGPLFAGALLAGGSSSSSVLFAIEPFVVIAGGAALALCWRPQHV